MDLMNVGVSQFWKVSRYVQHVSQISQSCQSETMGQCYIVNALFIFTAVCSVPEDWLNPVTVERIEILESGR